MKTSKISAYEYLITTLHPKLWLESDRHKNALKCCKIVKSKLVNSLYFLEYIAAAQAAVEE